MPMTLLAESTFIIGGAIAAGALLLFVLMLRKTLASSRELKDWLKENNYSMDRKGKVTGQIQGMAFEITVETRAKPHVHNPALADYFYKARVQLPPLADGRAGGWALGEEWQGSPTPEVSNYKMALMKGVSSAKAVLRKRKREEAQG